MVVFENSVSPTCTPGEDSGDLRYFTPMNPGPAKNGSPKMSFGKRQPTSGRNVPEYSDPMLNGRNAVA